MSKSSGKNPVPSCGCTDRCPCQRKLRCCCHDLNALLALALWDYNRARRRPAR